MAKYTTTIRNLMDNNFDFGLKDYPIFDEEYRTILNNKILMHYYMDEIGFETAGLFKVYINNKMNEIMPYYNELYKKQKDLLLNFDKTTNLTETFTRDNTTDTNTKSNSTSSNTASGTSKNVYQDTPMGSITEQDIDNYDHASSQEFNKNQNTSSIEDNSNLTGKATSLENYIRTKTGNNGRLYGIEILKMIKNNYMNIDEMVINELQDLFMGIM